MTSTNNYRRVQDLLIEMNRVLSKMGMSVGIKQNEVGKMIYYLKGKSSEQTYTTREAFILSVSKITDRYFTF